MTPLQLEQTKMRMVGKMTKLFKLPIFAYHKRLGPVVIDETCLALESTDSGSMFVLHEGDHKEVTAHFVVTDANEIVKILDDLLPKSGNMT